jgi:signal transduction histidine kinase
MTSHEMRTPATIATGYADMLISQETDGERRNDLMVIRDELQRLVLASERLIRTIQVHDQDRLTEVDLDALLRDMAGRWSVLAERNWVVDCDVGRHLCSAERLRGALDTLIENAVRYTEDGDTVRIIGQLHDDQVLIGVADSGPGLDPTLARALCRGELGPWGEDTGYTARDPKAQTGLGLALVSEAADSRGGFVVAGTSAEGGALVMMAVPRHLSLYRGRPYFPQREQIAV